MRDKDQFLLQEAYDLIQEAAKPCPCIKKDGKCMKKDCKCKRCMDRKKKGLKENHEEEGEVTTEDSQDAALDAALQKSIKEILLGAIRREELNEYSLERGAVVPEIMQAVQAHVKQQMQDAESKGYDYGMQATRDMDEFYNDELGR